MEKAQLVLFNPQRLADDVSRPEFAALLAEGWTPGSPMILEDPRDPEDPHRVAVMMYPPRPAGRVPRQVLVASWLVVLLVALGDALLLALVLSTP